MDTTCATEVESHQSTCHPMAADTDNVVRQHTSTQEKLQSCDIVVMLLWHWLCPSLRFVLVFHASRADSSCCSDNPNMSLSNRVAHACLSPVPAVKLPAQFYLNLQVQFQMVIMA